VPAVVRLLADDVLGAQRERVEAPVAAVYLKAFDEMAAQPGNTLLVAVRRDDVVGCHQTRGRLRRLLSTYDVSSWIYTKTVVVDERAVPFSHPVLTLHPRHAKDDELLLSTFLHEQLHWFFAERQEATEQAIADLRKRFPAAPFGGRAGARDETSTYLHLLVCYL